MAYNGTQTYSVRQLKRKIIMEIENLKALIKGVKLNSYQKALAVREFENLLASNGHENQALSMSGVSVSACSCTSEMERWNCEKSCENRPKIIQS